MNVTIEEAVRQITECASKSSDAARIVTSHDAVRQGDLYLLPLRHKPEGVEPTKERQLAPGTTKGSRHTIGDSAKVYTPPTKEALFEVCEIGLNPWFQELSNEEAAELIGPCFYLDTPTELDHPEHANAILLRGWWGVVHQPDREKEQIRKARD